MSISWLCDKNPRLFSVPPLIFPPKVVSSLFKISKSAPEMMLTLFFLLIPLIIADFECNRSPSPLGLTCFYQFYSNVGNNYNCSTRWTTDGNNYLLSMEIANIGAGEQVTVAWDNVIVSNNGSSPFSLQQYVPNGVTISISTGKNSQMSGIYFICPSGSPAAIAVTTVDVSYSQEPFILQQFSNTPLGPMGNLNVPGKWEITAETEVALISAVDASILNSPSTRAQLIWIYDGIGNNAKFIGTAADYNNKLYLSKAKTMTLYFVAIDIGTDYMAVIVNEAKNLEECSTFDAVFYANTLNFPQVTLNVTGASPSGACLTVLNRCQYQSQCDGVILWDVEQTGTADFYVYAGAPRPNPLQNGLLLENFNQNTTGLFPQNFAGNARTFYLAGRAQGSAILGFGDVGTCKLKFGVFKGFSVNPRPMPGRRGFVMTNFYPFNSTNMNGGSLDLVTVPYSYNVTLILKTTYAPVGSGAYLEFDKNGRVAQRIPFDISIDIDQVQMTIPVEVNAHDCRIFLWGGDAQNMGSYATYSFGEGPPTSTTTPGPSTSPRTTRQTVPTSTKTTPTAKTSTVLWPTYPTRTSTGIYFMAVTVFSLLIFFV